MGHSIRDVMTSNPCTIDAEKPIAYAAKMMKEEDVGLAPIVEGDKLVGMLTDRDIAIRQDRSRQDLDQALRIMAKHQVRRLAVLEKDGRLVGVVAQAEIARRVTTLVRASW